MRKSILILIIILIILLLSGCTTTVNFEERMYGTWVTRYKIKINDIYEPEYEYFVFLKNGKYQTNIFAHLFVEGSYIVKQEGSVYFVQLEYGGNTTIIDVTFADQNYDVLKIRRDGIITIFEKEV